MNYYAFEKALKSTANCVVKDNPYEPKIIIQFSRCSLAVQVLFDKLEKYIQKKY